MDKVELNVLNFKYAEDAAHKAIFLVDDKKIDSALDIILESVSLFQSRYRHDLVNHLIVSYLDFMRNNRQDKSLLDIEYCLAWSCREISSDLSIWDIFAQRFINLLESQNSPQYTNIIRKFKKEHTPMAIMMASGLVNPAKKAGIKVPENIDDYNKQDFPHWEVYLSMQMFSPIPHPSAHFDNAKIVAAIPDDEIKLVTPEQLTQKGYAIGYSH